MNAKALAAYATGHPPTLTLFVPPSPDRALLFHLVQRRHDLRRMLIAEKNRAQNPGVSQHLGAYCLPGGTTPSNQRANPGHRDVTSSSRRTTADSEDNPRCWRDRRDGVSDPPRRAGAGESTADRLFGGNSSSGE